ncbi:hypothetical protein [Halobacterium noricense]|uniref:hypothetical protein n=1 Tax=Halobacterium noricense TaxID=223182 RepID=UPI001E64D2E4|nr:hypothetical protein [Halobacterium noricense]UHH24952.1 hypothetical protein LT974_13320 [Halobacterium noricense]
MNRRTYLASVSVGTASLLAGCSSSGDSNETTTSLTTTEQTTTTQTTTTAPAEHEYAPDPWKNLEADRGETSTTITGQATLGAGQYAIRQAQFNQPLNVEVSVTVQDGSAIDIFGMSPDEFDRFRDRESPVYYDGFYETEVSDTTITGSMPAGDHRLVFDNSPVFGSEPSGEVTFDFETVISA